MLDKHFMIRQNLIPVRCSIIMEAERSENIAGFGIGNRVHSTLVPLLHNYVLGLGGLWRF